jgi:hypothetical protein
MVGSKNCHKEQKNKRGVNKGKESIFGPQNMIQPIHNRDNGRYLVAKDKKNET